MRITYEGFSFMSVLAFIILGSIIRQINLLVLLSGLMIAPFFFNWRISIKMMERLLARRRLPEGVNAGERFSVRWTVTNQRRKIPSWGIRVTDQIRKSGLGPKEAESIIVLVPPVGSGSQVEVAYQCLLPQRGIYEFGPASASSGFPVGLVRSSIHVRETASLVVAPAIGKLTRSWTLLMQSRNEGQTHKRRQRSVDEGEFYALRPWTSGDNPRQVHWRSSARHGELMVRQFEQQTRNQLILVLDLHDGEVPEKDIEHTLSFFNTILKQAWDGRSQLSVGIFGDQSWYHEKCDRVSMDSIRRCLAMIQPDANQGFAREITDHLRNSNRSQRVVIVSTRSQQDAMNQEDLSRPSCHWINVSAGESLRYFQPGNDDSVRFIQSSIGSTEGSER